MTLRSATGPVWRLGAVAAALLALAGCGVLSVSAAPKPASVSTLPRPANGPCPATPVRFSCTMRSRIALVRAYLSHRPGVVGVVLQDRSTGATWENSNAGTYIYMASTSKLAMAVTLLLQNQAGVIHLSAKDMSVMHHMLHVSSDSAADTLWFKFGAKFYTSYFPRIGLANAQYVSAPGIKPPYWGEMLCPATDLSQVITYVLDDMPAPLRDYLVTTLSHIAPDQQWGVWGAGKGNHPGNKDGWSVEKPGWIIDSVGFAGPRQRYTLAMMNSLNGQGGYHDGTVTLTEVASILFRGRQGPEPTISPTP